MKDAIRRQQPPASKAVGLRAFFVAGRPELLASLLVLNLIIVILLISSMRGILA